MSSVISCVYIFNLLNYSKLIQAVRLIADLLLDHQITDVQLWNSVLQKLMAFQQVMYSFI